VYSNQCSHHSENSEGKASPDIDVSATGPRPLFIQLTWSHSKGVGKP